MPAGPDVGAESQNRTGDTAIFSRVLYQLSYLGADLSELRAPDEPMTGGRFQPRIAPRPAAILS